MVIACLSILRSIVNLTRERIDRQSMRVSVSNFDQGEVASSELAGDHREFVTISIKVKPDWRVESDIYKKQSLLIRSVATCAGKLSFNQPL